MGVVFQLLLHHLEVGVDVVASSSEEATKGVGVDEGEASNREEVCSLKALAHLSCPLTDLHHV